MEMLKIDLYAYFGAKKEENNQGYLTVLRREDAVDENRLRPAVVVFAGGGYTHISKREKEPIALKYLSCGYNVFIVDYSVNCKFPTAFFESALAMAYIRKNCKELNVDASKIVTIGFSAGAHLSACLGIIPDDEMLKQKLHEVDYFNEMNVVKTISPNLMILCYPVISSQKGKCHSGSFESIANGDNRLIEQLSLEKRVTKNAPQCFIWHTFNDNSVPVYSSLKLAESYEKNGVSFELHVFENGRHGLSTADCEVYKSDEIPDHSTNVEKWFDLTIDWLKDKGFKVV